mmetsp:Transcript_16611/g.39700  ORF Transcript_16611/g.39700 Transcript_16611/m.39700 type:complete len:222 (-) Transcript_16611:665-1330(-)
MYPLRSLSNSLKAFHSSSRSSIRARIELRVRSRFERPCRARQKACSCTCCCRMVAKTAARRPAVGSAPPCAAALAPPSPSALPPPLLTACLSASSCSATSSASAGRVALVIHSCSSSWAAVGRVAGSLTRATRRKSWKAGEAAVPGSSVAGSPLTMSIITLKTLLVSAKGGASCASSMAVMATPQMSTLKSYLPSSPIWPSVSGAIQCGVPIIVPRLDIVL